MKKIVVSLMVIFVLIVGCGESKVEEEKKVEKENKPMNKKVHAKYRAVVYKTKDLKEYASVLAKGEAVTLLDEVKNTFNKKELTVAKIKQADDSVAYVLRKHLGGEPVVFIKNDVEVKIKPTETADTHVRVDKGTVGFIEDTKDNWIKVYIGKVNYNGKDRWVTGQWVKSGYSKKSDIVKDALIYEKSVNKLEENPEDQAALDNLKSLVNKDSMFSDMAAEKHLEFSE